MALRLAKPNPDLGYDILFSAASYLLRDGQSLRDSAVVQEARSRKALLDKAIASHKRRDEQRAARRAARNEDASPVDEIAQRYGG